MWEGGYRVPCLMQWIGRIPAGTSCDELASTIDIFPTVAKLINGKLPDHKIDGRDIWPLMSDEQGAQSPHESFACYYSGGQLQAVRDRQFKLVFPHKYRTLNGRKGGSGGSPVKYDHLEASLSLYDLKDDVSEKKNVAGQYPQVVERLMKVAEEYRHELGDKLTDRSGTGIRPADRVE